MQRTLADTGLSIALFPPQDALHRRAAELLRDYRGKLYSTWQAPTEALGILPLRRQDRFLEWVKDCCASGALEIVCTDPADLDRARTVVGQYRHLPMDFALVSIWLLALRTGISRVASCANRNFSIYRLPGKRRFKNVLA